MISCDICLPILFLTLLLKPELWFQAVVTPLNTCVAFTHLPSPGCMPSALEETRNRTCLPRASRGAAGALLEAPLGESTREILAVPPATEPSYFKPMLSITSLLRDLSILGLSG